MAKGVRRCWDTERQDISEYWYNRIRTFGYLPASLIILSNEIPQLLSGNADETTPAFLIFGAYFLVKGIKGAIRLVRESNLENRV